MAAPYTQETRACKMGYGDWFESRATRIKMFLGRKIPLTLIMPIYAILTAGLLVRAAYMTIV